LVLDDVIGDLGCCLSKGEKKLLMLARALLTNKPILLFDEPFEALDECTKQQLYKKLNQLSETRTIVIFSRAKGCQQLNIRHHVLLNHVDTYKTIDNKPLLSANLIELAPHS